MDMKGREGEKMTNGGMKKTEEDNERRVRWQWKNRSTKAYYGCNKRWGKQAEKE